MRRDQRAVELQPSVGMTTFQVPSGMGPNAPGNPGGNGNIPGPWPTSQSIDFWSQRFTLIWGTSPAGLRIARWSTPTFDLRPELKAAPGQGGFNVQTVYRSGMGAGGHLFVKVTGLESTPSATANLQVLYIESADPVEPINVTPIVNQSVDITSEFAGTTNAALLEFWPPGDGYPVRYWRLTLIFLVLVAQPDPQFSISAAYY